jgi:hypothetical protein
MHVASTRTWQLNGDETEKQLASSGGVVVVVVIVIVDVLVLVTTLVVVLEPGIVLVELETVVVAAPGTVVVDEPGVDVGELGPGGGVGEPLAPTAVVVVVVSGPPVAMKIPAPAAPAAPTATAAPTPTPPPTPPLTPVAAITPTMPAAAKPGGRGDAPAVVAPTTIRTSSSTK